MVMMMMIDDDDDTSTSTQPTYFNCKAVNGPVRRSSPSESGASLMVKTCH